MARRSFLSREDSPQARFHPLGESSLPARFVPELLVRAQGKAKPAIEVGIADGKSMHNVVTGVAAIPRHCVRASEPQAVCVLAYAPGTAARTPRLSGPGCELVFQNSTERVFLTPTPCAWRAS